MIRVGSIKSDEKQRAERHIILDVLPEFVKWAIELVSLPRNSQTLEDKEHIYFRRDFN